MWEIINSEKDVRLMKNERHDIHNNIKTFLDYLKRNNVGGILLLTICYDMLGLLSLPQFISVPTGIIDKPIIVWLYTFAEKNALCYAILMIALSLLLSTIGFHGFKRHIDSNSKLKLSPEDVNDNYSIFMGDAKEIHVFGGDLDFLNNSPSQLQTIKELGDKCKILYSPKSKEIKTDLYSSLVESGVQIRQYRKEDNIHGIRGQIGIDQQGLKKGLFVNKKYVERKGNRYQLVTIDNEFLTEVLDSQFEKDFQQGKDPLIKLVLFDLGGVFFDGDFNKDFLNEINDKFSAHIRPNRKQKLLLNRDLNIGNKTIIEWVEEKLRRDLNEKEKQFVLEKWTSVWKPNSNMQTIANEIKAAGFEIGIFSNLDEINGGIYYEKGYFQDFPNQYHFLSYRMKKVKPEKDMFLEILETTKMQPQEILLIDDHEKNITEASKVGMKTIHFSLNQDPNLNHLREQLSSARIL